MSSAARPKSKTKGRSRPASSSTYVDESLFSTSKRPSSLSNTANNSNNNHQRASSNSSASKAVISSDYIKSLKGTTAGGSASDGSDVDPSLHESVVISHSDLVQIKEAAGLVSPSSKKKKKRK